MRRWPGRICAVGLCCDSDPSKSAAPLRFLISALPRSFSRQIPTPRGMRRDIYLEGDLYLSRYYLLGAPTMPGGGPAWDKDGRVYPEARRPWCGLYLHKIHRPDADRKLHNHPWWLSLSLILRGGYREKRQDGHRWYAPGSINIIRDRDYHRITDVRPNTWTLFLAIGRHQDWGFKT